MGLKVRNDYGFLRSKAVFQIFLLIGTLFFFGYSLGEVNAEEEVGCCEVDSSGNHCLPTTNSNCDLNSGSWTPVSCEQTSFCSTGCCFDGSSGVCDDRVPKAGCVSNSNALFFDELSCDAVSNCDLGCCELGTNFVYNSKFACQDLIDQYYPSLNIYDVWDSTVPDEYACIYQSTEDDLGCCVDTDTFGYPDSCIWGTRGTCSSDGSEEDASNFAGFYKETYCSNANLQCPCESQDYRGCVGEDIYWFDSCGNQEEKVEECDYALGNICKENDDDSASCVSVNCVDTQDFPDNTHDSRMGGPRLNGESWCTYDSPSGGFYDRPGSRQYRHLCVNGEEKVEECEDFRNEICVQGEAVVGSQTVTSGACRDIESFSKLDIDEYIDTENLEDSTIQPGTSDFNDEDKKLVSSTSVPVGSKFWNGENSGECKKGKSECTVIWARKNWLDDWDIEANEECETGEFIGDSNDFCRMFGDCGADVNLLEIFTDDGLDVSWSGKNSFDDKTANSPKSVPSSFVKELKSKEGIFGGMDKLNEAFTDSFTLSTSEHVTIYQLATILAYSFDFSTTLFGFFEQSMMLSPLGAIFFILISIIWGDELGEILGKIMGYDQEFRDVTVSCSPWQAPAGGDDCSRCDDDVRYDEDVYDAPVKCSEYRCKSLGTGCELINEGTEEQACVDTYVNDPNPPYITPWHEILTTPYSVDVTANGYDIEPIVEYYQPLTFGIELNEYGKCKYAEELGIPYENMVNSFGTSLDSEEKEFTVNSPAPSTEYEYYIKCIDRGGTTNPTAYVIRFDTSSEPDIQPPTIDSTSIVNGAYLAYNTTETSLELELNEPVSLCTWSKGVDLPIEQIHGENSFSCGNSVNCLGTLNGLESGTGTENLFYFRCADLAGNQMNQGYEFRLVGSDELNIISIEPANGIYYYSDFVLSLVTANGAESGKSICKYVDDTGAGDLFLNTDSSYHTQPQTRSAGDYLYTFTCEDIAGNLAEGSAEIKIDVDDNAPIIENLYVQGGVLSLITNEPSTCEYSYDNPSFIVGNGYEMVGVNVVQHSLTLTEDVYYIQCYDEFGNIGEMTTVYYTG